LKYNIASTGIGLKFGSWGLWWGACGIFVSLFGIGYSHCTSLNLNDINQGTERVIDKYSSAITDTLCTMGDSYDMLREELKELKDEQNNIREELRKIGRTEDRK